MTSMIRQAPPSLGMMGLFWIVLVVFAVVAAPGSTAPREPYQTAGDVTVYLGVIPGPVVRGHPPRQMHGGAAGGLDEYHLTVALFERGSGARIENAEVWATISGLGHVGTTRLQLKPMSIADTITYGGFVRMTGKDRYTISVEAHRPESKTPLKVQFTYDKGL